MNLQFVVLSWVTGATRLHWGHDAFRMDDGFEVSDAVIDLIKALRRSGEHNAE